MKVHDRTPPNQTNEEERGSLPEKEFRIQAVKVTHNLKNKEESPINTLETWIEKRQKILKRI